MSPREDMFVGFMAQLDQVLRVRVGDGRGGQVSLECPALHRAAHRFSLEP